MKSKIVNRIFVILIITNILLNWILNYNVFGASTKATLDDITVRQNVAGQTTYPEVKRNAVEELRKQLETKYNYTGTVEELANTCGIDLSVGNAGEVLNTSGKQIKIDDDTTIILGFNMTIETGADKSNATTSNPYGTYVEVKFNNINVTKNTGADNTDEKNQEAADSNTITSSNEVVSNNTYYSSQGAEIWDGGKSELGIGGILLNPLMDLVLAVGDAVNAILQTVMYAGEDSSGVMGTIVSVVKNAFDIMTTDSSDAEFDSGKTSSSISVNLVYGISQTKYPHIHFSCEEIFSGKVGILNIDFISGEGQTRGLANVRTVIASWYRTLRLIAIIGFLSVLIYTGIRIMLSSTAEDKAKYKEWIINWFIGVAILFSMHYIMSFIITIIKMFNEGLSASLNYISVNAIGKATFNTNLIGLVRFCAQSDVTIFKAGYMILYVMLITYSLKFTFVYLKRLINMAFLTLIAPIVAFTYPLDKLADGQAQGFGMWIKEYVFNALLQPMHLILYYVLVGSSMVIAAENPIYAIAVLAFMSEGERLLRKIFGFDKANAGTVKGMQDAFAAATIATSLRGMLGRSGQNGKNGAQGKMSLAGAKINTDYKNINLSENFNSNGGIGGSASGNAGPASSGSSSNSVQGNSRGGNGTTVVGNPGSTGSASSGNPGSNGRTGAGNPGSNGITGTGNPGNAGGAGQGAGSRIPQNNNQQMPIRNKAARVAKAVGKRMVRPIYDFDRSKKYNGKRFIRNVAKGVLGTSVGLTAAAVQAGISLTDGKYSPAEGLAAFSAGFAFAGRGVDKTTDTIKEGFLESQSKEEKMKAYQEDFRNREDVIQFCKENYGDEWKEYRDRMTDNYVANGFTNLSEMKEMLKYSKAISGDTKGLTQKEKEELYKNSDLSAMAIKSVQNRKRTEGSLATAYNEDKQNQYIQAKTQNMSDEEAKKEAMRIRGEDAALRYYNSIVKG